MILTKDQYLVNLCLDQSLKVQAQKAEDGGVSSKKGYGYALLTRTHETRKGIHSEVLHRVMCPNVHGNVIQKKKGYASILHQKTEL